MEGQCVLVNYYYYCYYYYDYYDDYYDYYYDYDYYHCSVGTTTAETATRCKLWLLFLSNPSNILKTFLFFSSFFGGGTFSVLANDYFPPPLFSHHCVFIHTTSQTSATPDSVSPNLPPRPDARAASSLPWDYVGVV